MRLWHKDLIRVLPKQQLIAQWRECCAIARSIALDGKTNHILINRIMEYPIEHFLRYSQMVYFEMVCRDYNCNFYNFSKWLGDVEKIEIISQNWPAQLTAMELIRLKEDDIFYNWHTDRYYWQCYHNLEEKFDCGGISQDEWETICDEVCLRL